MPVSKKDRFEIFKRDEFRCVYCGRQPPSVTLELEHIQPKSKGGLDELDNYCTSCYECNRGKGARLLDSAPPGAIERLAFLQEKLEDLAALKQQSAISTEIRRETMAIRQELTELWCNAFKVDAVQKQIITMMFNRLRWIDIETMRELIEACAEKMEGENETSCCKYMAGILRRHLGDLGIDFESEAKKGGL